MCLFKHALRLVILLLCSISKCLVDQFRTSKMRGAAILSCCCWHLPWLRKHKTIFCSCIKHHLLDNSTLSTSLLPSTVLKILYLLKTHLCFSNNRDLKPQSSSNKSPATICLAPLLCVGAQCHSKDWCAHSHSALHTPLFHSFMMCFAAEEGEVWAVQRHGKASCWKFKLPLSKPGLLEAEGLARGEERGLCQCGGKGRRCFMPYLLLMFSSALPWHWV